MPTATIETAIKMLETLPPPTEEQAVEHLREYIEDLRDEAKWNAQFDRHSTKLSNAAAKARKEVAEGKSLPMDFAKL